MTQPEIVMVNDASGDWHAMYVDGELRREGHSLSATHVLEALLFAYRAVEVDSDWLEAAGLPEEWDSVIEEGLDEDGAITMALDIQPTQRDWGRV